MLQITNMTDGGLPPGMSFPQKVHTDEEDFVIELDESHMAGGPDGYGLDERGRCKRRKRCGQCGPCLVKENCMKCHFCIRKDVLKQTCIYRKCVYLRSKPKPYHRPHQSPQGRSGASPSRDTTRASPLVKSPSGVQPGMSFPEPVINMHESRPENPFFPPQLTQQAQVGVQQNNGYPSQTHTSLERAPSLPNTAGNMNMQMSMSPHVPNHAASPPVPKPPDPTVHPQPVNSPMAALSGIPLSSCNSVPHISPMQPIGPTIPPVMPQITNSALSSIPHIPQIPNMPGIGERSVNDFRHPDQFSLGPHHPHPHYPPVHPHNVMAAHRESSFFAEPPRISHMNFNHANHMDSLGRGPSDSSCMYHPGLPYSMAGHYQPSGPSFLSGAAEINPFRSNFLNSFPPGYSYPPDRYREGFGPLPFTRLGISPTTSFPQYPGQNGGYGVGNAFSQQYYNSQHGCPKNGSRPPVSPNIDDVKVIQEGYKIKDSSSKLMLACDVKQEKDSDDMSSPSPVHNKRPNSAKNRTQRKDSFDRTNMFPFNQLSPRIDHLRPWNDMFSPRPMHRSDPFLSPRSSYLETSRMTPWFSPRRDDVCSRASSSTVSLDFECEVIGVDDQQVNALIRSDGCNSIEIEFDNRSMCSNDSSPRKLPSRSSITSDIITPEKGSGFGALFSRVEMSEREREHSIRKAFNLFDSCHKGLAKVSTSGRKQDEGEKGFTNMKGYFKNSVCIRQDLGDEGIVQVELPGHRVSIENIVFTDEMLKNSSNIKELTEFITSNTPPVFG